MFDAFLEPIADAYDALPLDNPAHHHYWRALADDSVKRAARIREELDVRETNADESYESPEAMVADIASGRFVVSRANSDHPVWTQHENVAFRIVHDVLGHYAASEWDGSSAASQWFIDTGERTWIDVAGFDWTGENRACAAHFPLLTPTARVALFTECIAQTGFAIARGGFGPQKVGAIALPDPGANETRWQLMRTMGSVFLHGRVPEPLFQTI